MILLLHIALATLANANLRPDPIINLNQNSYMRNKYPSITTAANLQIDRHLNTSYFDAFQVYPPLPDYGAQVYTMQLMDHTFANSYYKPYKVSYRAPDVEFNKVVLQLHIKTSGYQYDRLGSIFLGDVEIWRTSTAEPGGREIKFGHIKDVSRYLSLFQDDHELIVTLNNVVDSRYNGVFETVLNATFFNTTYNEPLTVTQMLKRSKSIEAANVTPLLVNKNAGDVWISPVDEMAVFVDALPRNTTRIGIEITATGNSNEEFWFGAVTNKICQYLNLNSKNQFPVRVVDIYINDELAGQALPEPVIFTGGLSPFMWAPIVGIDTFDIPSMYVDLSPYLPQFWNQGNTIRLSITNGMDNETIKNHDWLVTAALLTWEFPNVTGDGHRTLDITPKKRHYYNIAPYYALKNEHTTHHHDADLLHQAVGMTSQLTREAHLVFLHDNGKIEALSTNWNQALLSHSFTSVDDLGIPRQIGHYQTEMSSVEFANLQTLKSFKPVDRLIETPMLINMENKDLTQEARIIRKTSKYDPSIGSQIYYLVSNASMTQTTRKKIINGKATSQIALIHQPGNQVYMRHVGASDGSVVFDGRWRGKFTDNTVAPDRMNRFIKQVEPIKEFIVNNAKAVKKENTK